MSPLSIGGLGLDANKTSRANSLRKHLVHHHRRTTVIFSVETSVCTREKTLDVASVFLPRLRLDESSAVIRVTGRRQRMYARAALVALILGQARQAAATACATYPCSCADHPCACIREGESPDGEESGNAPGGLAPHLNAEQCAEIGFTFCGGCGDPTQTPRPTPKLLSPGWRVVPRFPLRAAA